MLSLLDLRLGLLLGLRLRLLDGGLRLWLLGLRLRLLFGLRLRLRFYLFLGSALTIGTTVFGLLRFLLSVLLGRFERIRDVEITS